MTKLTSEILKIVAAGGSVEVDGASKLGSEIVKIATAAATSGSKVIVKNSSSKLTSELVKIAAAGKGAVTFMDL